jgi:hypothetical protein|tara:strand:+ start:19862 stop:20194 length:333 start_codon:yes stop_codon:yes gene_type:complete
MNIDQYLLMCEQMGWEPKEEDIPIEVDSLSYEAQCALILFQALPDNWEGMSGSWMGKDYSGLMAIMDIHQMDSKKEIFTLLKSAEAEAGKYYAQKQKERDAMAKAKSRSR